MMTKAQWIAFLEESAADDLKWAAIHHDNSNWEGALGNWGQAAEHRFERALLGWRTGLLHPEPDLRATLEVSERAVSFLEATDVGPLRARFDPVPGAYSAIMLDRPESPVVVEARRYATWPPPRGLTPDRPLDAWLLGDLAGEGPGQGVDAAGSVTRGRTSLLGETFTTYFDLIAIERSDDLPASELTRRALALFARRRRDEYYSGGVAYEGGGPDNDAVIDYRLATIWHVRGWDASGLTPEERLHVQLPSRP